MEHRSVMPILRGHLLNGTSKFGLLKSRTIVVPIVIGAAMAMSGVSLTPTPALAAAVVCAPDASGTAIGTVNGAATEENCSGPGDTIDYSTAATQNGSVLLDTSTGVPVVISGGGGNGITVNAAGHDISISDVVLTTPDFASISGAASGIVMTGTGGNLSVTLTANPNGVPVTGVAFDGINVSTTGSGSVGVATIGNVSGSTSGIFTSADSGTTTITQTAGTITSPGDGLFFTAGTGTVTINTSAGATIVGDNDSSGGERGIRGTATGAIAGTINGDVAGDRAIDLTVTGTGSIDLTFGGNVSGNTSGITTSADTGATTITQTAGTITSQADGLFVLAGTGAVTINTSAGANIVGNSSGGGVGILATATGAVTGTINGDVAGDRAVDMSVTGSGSVDLSFGGVVSGNTSAIRTSADTGATTITQTAGTITSQGDGLVFTAGTGAVTINTSAGANIVGDSDSSGGGVGILGTATGAVTGAINGDVKGDWAVDIAATGTGTINLSFGGNVIGTDGAVHLTTVDGDNTASFTGVGKTIDGGATGNATILLTTSGAGNISITTTAGTNVIGTGGGGGIVGSNTGSGSVTIVSNGDVGTGAPVAGTGIRGSITDGANGSNVSITAANVNATGNGVLGETAGNGTVAINTTGAITAVTNGIVANTLGSGNVMITSAGPILVSGASGSAGITESTLSGTGSITVNGAVTAANGSGLVVASTTGDITINNANVIKGAGTDVDPVVKFTSTGGAINGSLQLNNGPNGVIQSNGNLSGDLAIAATTAGTGFVQVNNSGRIAGRVDFSGASAVQFNNLSTQSWHSSGTSNFTNGNDELNNGNSGGSVTALIATSGNTTWNFLGGADVINNYGPSLLVAGETAGPSLLTINGGTLTINNSGTIVLGSLDGGLTNDGESNDYIDASRTPFVSSGNSRLMVDTVLGANSSTLCLGNPYSDCLSIGNSTGSGTRVSINNSSSGPGGLNLIGMTVVQAASGSAGDFALSLADTNVISTPQGLAVPDGFVQYQLFFDAPNVQWDLAGVPNAGAVEMLPLMGGLQTLWWTTADGWNERTAAVRHDFAAAKTGNAPLAAGADTFQGWSLWGKAYYGQLNKDGSQSIDVYGNRLTYLTSYRQESGGFQAGGDFLMRDDANGAWLLGGLAGFNKSDLEYKADNNSADYTVWNLGLYGSYVSDGPVFADFLVKDDIASIDPTIATVASVPTINANSIGVSGTIGARFVAMGSLALEPMLNLGYVNTNVNTLDVPGTTFDWNEGESFRGRLSFRVSADLQDAGTVVQPFFVAGIGQEFEGQNSLLISSGVDPGQSLKLTDQPLRTYGLGSIGFNIFSDGPWSGFGKADGLYSSHEDGWALRAGIRYAIGPAAAPPPR